MPMCACLQKGFFALLFILRRQNGTQLCLLRPRILNLPVKLNGRAARPWHVCSTCYLTALNLIPLSVNWENGHFTGHL